MAPDRPAKRALFVVITDYPGGAERVASVLASELASRPDWRVEVLVVCSQLPNSFMSQAVSPRVRVRYGPARSWHLSFLCLPLRLLFRRYELVYCTHVYVNALASTMRRYRLFRTARLVLRESMSLFDRFSGGKARLFKALYRRYGQEDLVIAQTSYMADHVRPWLPAASRNRLHSLANPVDAAAIGKAMTEDLDPAIKDRLAGRTNIVFCGRFVDFKRPELALETFRLLSARNASLQLVYIGAGPLESEVRERAAAWGLSQDVMFLGQRANPYPIMAACQYGLLTSANEGFPNVVLEMMACGLRKIVVTPCAGDLDVLPGIALTSSHDVAEIAETLSEAIESGADCSPVYRAYASERSAAGYIRNVATLIGARELSD